MTPLNRASAVPLSSHRCHAPRRPGWAAVTAAFGAIREEIRLAELDDTEPAARFTPEWGAWLARHADRLRQVNELDEARALTTDPNNVCPFAVEGLGAFLRWCEREHSE